MKRIIYALLLTLLLPVAVSAQTTTVSPSSHLAWDQANVSGATEAQSFTYRLYADGATTGTVLTGVVCTGTTAVTCAIPFPAFTPGAHTVQFTATNAAGESLKSAPPFAFTFVLVPSAPANVRAQ